MVVNEDSIGCDLSREIADEMIVGVSRYVLGWFQQGTI